MTNAWENMEMQMSGSILRIFLIIFLLQPSSRVRSELHQLYSVLIWINCPTAFDVNDALQIFCLHGGLSPSLDTLDNIRALDRIQEVSCFHLSDILFKYMSNF